MVSPIAASMEKLNRIQEEIAEEAHQRNNPVIRVCAAIKEYVQDFEKDLDAEHEVGVRLVSFGGAVAFHAEQIGFRAPNVITFYGTTAEGEKVQLIQHVSQLSFLLKSVKKLDETPRRIGFLWDE
jgi:methylmalonyl-CoA mutase cobalamin-binding subunit